MATQLNRHGAAAPVDMLDACSTPECATTKIKPSGYDLISNVPLRVGVTLRQVLKTKRTIQAGSRTDSPVPDTRRAQKVLRQWLAKEKERIDVEKRSAKLSIPAIKHQQGADRILPSSTGVVGPKSTKGDQASELPSIQEAGSNKDSVTLTIACKKAREAERSNNTDEQTHVNPDPAAVETPAKQLQGEELRAVGLPSTECGSEDDRLDDIDTQLLGDDCVSYTLKQNPRYSQNSSDAHCSMKHVRLGEDEEDTQSSSISQHGKPSALSPKRRRANSGPRNRRTRSDRRPEAQKSPEADSRGAKTKRGKDKQKRRLPVNELITASEKLPGDRNSGSASESMELSQDPIEAAKQELQNEVKHPSGPSGRPLLSIKGNIRRQKRSEDIKLSDYRIPMLPELLPRAKTRLHRAPTYSDGFESHEARPTGIFMPWGKTHRQVIAYQARARMGRLMLASERSLEPGFANGQSAEIASENNLHGKDPMPKEIPKTQNIHTVPLYTPEQGPRLTSLGQKRSIETKVNAGIRDGGDIFPQFMMVTAQQVSDHDGYTHNSESSQDSESSLSTSNSEVENEANCGHSKQHTHGSDAGELGLGGFGTERGLLNEHHLFAYQSSQASKGQSIEVRHANSMRNFFQFTDDGLDKPRAILSGMLGETTMIRNTLANTEITKPLYEPRERSCTSMSAIEPIKRGLMKMNSWIQVREPSGAAFSEYRKKEFQKAKVAVNDPKAAYKLHASPTRLPESIVKPGGWLANPHIPQITRRRMKSFPNLTSAKSVTKSRHSPRGSPNNLRQRVSSKDVWKPRIPTASNISIEVREDILDFTPTKKPESSKRIHRLRSGTQASGGSARVHETSQSSHPTRESQLPYHDTKSSGSQYSGVSSSEAVLESNYFQRVPQSLQELEVKPMKFSRSKSMSVRHLQAQDCHLWNHVLPSLSFQNMISPAKSGIPSGRDLHAVTRQASIGMGKTPESKVQRVRSLPFIPPFKTASS